MKPLRSWPVPDSLPLALAAFVLMLALGVSICSLALERLAQARQGLERNESGLRASRDDLRQLPDRLQLARTAQADFRHMERLAFVGDGERLNWISALARVGRQIDSQRPAGSLALTWQLGPRQRHANHPDILVTPMVLRAGPMNMADLAQLLAGLDESARGISSVERCVLDLPEGQARDTGQVECRLVWWNWRAVQPVANDPAAGLDG